MEPVTIALLGTFGGGMLLRWFEVTMAKSKSRSKQEELDKAKIAKEKELEAEANKALACPYYFSRDYEDRMIEAGIMTRYERNICDEDDCEYCEGVRNDIQRRDWNLLEKKQHEELEKARKLKRDKYNPGPPIIVAGDFNTHHKTSVTLEFERVFDPVRNVDTIRLKKSTGDLGPN